MVSNGSEKGMFMTYVLENEARMIVISMQNACRRDTERELPTYERNRGIPRCSTGRMKHPHSLQYVHGGMVSTRPFLRRIPYHRSWGGVEEKVREDLGLKDRSYGSRGSHRFMNKRVPGVGSSHPLALDRKRKGWEGSTWHDMLSSLDALHDPTSRDVRTRKSRRESDAQIRRSCFMHERREW